MKLHRFDPNARRSRMVVFNNVAYLGGQFSDCGGDVAVQTSEALSRVDALLARAGTDKHWLLSAQIWLTSMADFDAMNAVWNAWLPEGCAPTRCCAAVTLASPKMRVEIMVSAAIGATETLSHGEMASALSGPAQERYDEHSADIRV